MTQTTTTSPIQEAVQARQRGREEAQEVFAAAVESVDAAFVASLRLGVTEGMSMTALARAAGMSRQNLYDLFRRYPAT